MDLDNTTVLKIRPITHSKGEHCWTKKEFVGSQTGPPTQNALAFSGELEGRGGALQTGGGRFNKQENSDTSLI